MLKLNVFYFYEFGGAIARLRELTTSGLPLSDWRWASMQTTYQWLQRFSTRDDKDDPTFHLPKSEHLAGLFAQQLEPFVAALGSDHVLSNEEVPALNAWIQKFTAALEQELQDSHVYFVPQIGVYLVSTLIDDASAHLSEEAQEVFGGKVREDFDMAGEGIAFDMFTASGFHALRAVEEAARRYHKIVTAASAQIQEPLGPVIGSLRKQYEKEGSPRDSSLGLVVSLLESINKIYRCPIMHPEMTLNFEGAKKVFDVAAIAISEMATDMKARGTRRGSA